MNPDQTRQAIAASKRGEPITIIAGDLGVSPSTVFRLLSSQPGYKRKVRSKKNPSSAKINAKRKSIILSLKEEGFSNEDIGKMFKLHPNYVSKISSE